MQRALRQYETNQRLTELDVTAERRRLVEEHGALVKKVARRIARRLPQGSEIEEGDLFSAGILGLFEAAARFDPEVGYPFETFAEFRIKGAMLDTLRRRDFLPRRLRHQANKYEKKRHSLEQRLGRAPSDEELAAALELPLDELLQLQDSIAPYHFVSAEDPELNLPGERPQADALLSRRQQVERLEKALERLPPRDAMILELHFLQELTLREIAEMLDLSIGRISQLKTAALERLRKWLKD
jgi:RNA polymerase sigma factor for flagellar operon FliA